MSQPRSPIPWVPWRRRGRRGTRTSRGPRLCMATERWDDVPRQDGRRFVVTGASGGIGLETAKVLADRGACVVLAVRNLDRGRAAAEQMSGDVELGLLDL